MKKTNSHKGTKAQRMADGNGKSKAQRISRTYKVSAVINRCAFVDNEYNIRYENVIARRPKVDAAISQCQKEFTERK